MTLIRNSRLKLSQGRIFWREAGKGPTLVFLHGSWNDGNQWLPIIERLNGAYHCLAPDLLGFGESEQPDVHYSIELEVDYLAEYLEALKIPQVYFVGHSLGGWIAASFAIKYPDLVQGLVLLAPEGLQVKGIRKNWASIRFLTGQPKLVAWLLRSLQFLARVKIFGWRPKVRQLQEQLQQIVESPAPCQLLFQRHPSEIQAEFLQDRLPWLKIPVLIVRGEKDTPTVATLCHAYGELIPQAKLKVIPQGGHDLAQQTPDAIAQFIDEFVNSTL